MAVIIKRRLVCSASLCLADVSGNANGVQKASEVGLAGPANWSLEQEPRFPAERVSLEVGQAGGILTERNLDD